MADEIPSLPATIAQLPFFAAGRFPKPDLLGRCDGDSITHINEGRPGTGILDWKTFLRGVADLPLNPPIMMEHLRTQDEYLQARDYIFAQGQEIGVTF